MIPLDKSGQLLLLALLSIPNLITCKFKSDLRNGSKAYLKKCSKRILPLHQREYTYFKPTLQIKASERMGKVKVNKSSSTLFLTNFLIFLKPCVTEVVQLFQLYNYFNHILLEYFESLYREIPYNIEKELGKVQRYQHCAERFNSGV